MKTTIALATAALIGLTAAPGFATDKTTTETSTKVMQDANGNYEKKVSEETKTPNDTMTNESKTKTEMDGKGNSDAMTTTEHTNDPSGLFNKEKTTTKDEVKAKNGKVTHKHKKRVNGKTTEDTTTTSPAPAQ
jgi:hypothetical protein